MGNISRKSKKKLIQKMKATYHEIQLIKIMYTEEALPRYKVPTKLYCRNDGRDNYPHIAMFFGKKNHPRDVVEVYQHHVNLINILREALRDLEVARNHFENCDPEFVDAAIFELNAAECRVDAVRRCVG